MDKEATGITEVLIRRIETENGITELTSDAHLNLNERIMQAWNTLLKEIEKRRVENGRITGNSHS